MAGTGKKFYAVAAGRQPGIYDKWSEAEAQIKKFSGALYKGFSTQAEAEEWFQQSSTKSLSSEPPLTSPPPGTTLIYTDGSSKHGIGGYGVVAITAAGEKYRLHGRVPILYPGSPTTNNIAELYSIWVALASESGPVILYSDSQYSINALTTWIHAWKKRDWAEVKNKEIIQRIEPLLTASSTGAPRKVTLRYVAAHVGIELNEEVDQLANLGRIQSEILRVEKTSV